MSAAQQIIAFVTWRVQLAAVNGELEHVGKPAPALPAQKNWPAAQDATVPEHGWLLPGAGPLPDPPAEGSVAHCMHRGVPQEGGISTDQCHDIGTSSWAGQ